MPGYHSQTSNITTKDYTNQGLHRSTVQIDKKICVRAGKAAIMVIFCSEEFSYTHIVNCGMYYD